MNTTYAFHNGTKTLRLSEKAKATAIAVFKNKGVLHATLAQTLTPGSIPGHFMLRKGKKTIVDYGTKFTGTILGYVPHAYVVKDHKARAIRMGTPQFKIAQKWKPSPDNYNPCYSWGYHFAFVLPNIEYLYGIFFCSNTLRFFLQKETFCNV